MTQKKQIALQFQNTVNETDDKHHKPTTYHLGLLEPTLLTFL